LQGASGAPREQMECPQRHRATKHHLTQWRVTELYGVRWRRRRRRCREESVLWADKLEVQRRRVRRVHLCRRQAPLQGVSGATRPQIICPQRHCASSHRLIQWRVTELYGRNGVGGSKDAAKIVYSVYEYCDGFLTEWKCRDAGICCQPGGLARRFWGTASANGMPATSSRDQSPPNTMARHRALRRATASASAKMQRRRVFLGFPCLSVGPVQIS
jgi:hypothetical protein